MRPFPSTDQGRWQVSPAGGKAPRWSGDGRDLYFLNTPTAGASLAFTLMVVPVLSTTGFTTGPPAVIADLPLGVNDAYDVAPDGRFLLSAPGTTGSGSASAWWWCRTGSASSCLESPPRHASHGVQPIRLNGVRRRRIAVSLMVFDYNSAHCWRIHEEADSVRSIDAVCRTRFG